MGLYKWLDSSEVLKIGPMRATLGKVVSAKLKNEKDDKARIIEFSLTEIAVTHVQLDHLVACGKHERKFSAVAFSSRDAISELRHFKATELAIEVQHAAVLLKQIGDAGEVKLHDCTVKNIKLLFETAERCMMSCKVWAPLLEESLYTIGSWGSEDLFATINSPKHGDDAPAAQGDIDD